ncbi:MAG: zincin-like metallopeptidase domain-containing protein [Cyanobacteriota bacterium]|nr:zincin-like metallopeptidase domain-containing protein [Cyanobacteriota bacterium]
MAARKGQIPAPSAVDDRLVSSLIALMESGTAPWRREWDAHQGGHHVNLLSGRSYRGANPILLTIGLHQRGASLPYWCGVVEAKSHGLLPKRGSKAVIVLRPQVWRRGAGAEEPDAPASSPLAREEERRCADGRDPRPWVRYRPVPLFNAEDLAGEALPGLIRARMAAEQPFQRSEPERLAQAEAVLRAWAVPMEHGGDRAFYNPQTDRIQLPDRRAFHSAAALYATWAHEALHSTGHATRLGRDLSGSLGSAAYAREELVAELGAVLLGERLEIGSDVANHAAYLVEWIRLLKQTPSLLYKLLSEARQAADLICPPQPLTDGV